MTDRIADPLLVAATLFVALALIGFTIVMARRERRRRAAWSRQYFRGGGLVWSLVQRWSRTPRLTDQRRDR